MSDPPAIPADDKDWTWILQRPCPECGYRADTPTADIPDIIRSNVERWQQVLNRPDVHERPSPTVWSSLEYACHVRDLYRIFGQRLELMLTLDDPVFANWDQDATALEAQYWDDDPAECGKDLAAAGEELARTFERVEPEQWARTGRRTNGSVFTVQTLGWYFLHDDVHHLFDVNG